ncbi:SPOR domain-containing protein [Thiobacillus sp.]|uniref:SPOR domain-containing protein n=1 Tax=Thiobacillus sp. TaxID=924 RepID=UPI00286E8FE1|nr:SPOR domain-containing protein [Thiobacillus sp.]
MAKPASSKSKRSGGSSVFTGVLIGLTVGAVLAVGVALFVTGNNPFKSGTATPETEEKTPPPAVEVAPTATPDTAPPPVEPEAAPSFDFYKVLPGGAPSDLPPVPDTTANHPLYYLQAGAFQNADDADNLKAQLALLGVEAEIQTTEIAGKGMFHRVRVGPLRAMDEVNSTRSLLTQNNIPATLVKETPVPQERP